MRWIFLLSFVAFLIFVTVVFLQYQKKKNLRQKRRNIKESLRIKEEERRNLELRKPAEVMTTASPPPPPRRGRTSLILLVEDSPTMLVALKKILERWEYKVITAQDGREAWGQLQKSKPDLVISDIDMPKLNGLELLKLIRTDIVFMHIPVILITGDASFHLQASQEGGVSGLLSKPFEDKTLVDQVRYLLQE